MYGRTNLSNTQITFIYMLFFSKYRVTGQFRDCSIKNQLRKTDYLEE